MTAARVPTSSTGAGQHGPTKARRQPGELALVPDVPRQVRKIVLEVEQLDEGRLRFTQPGVPGWVVVGRTPVELVRAIRAGFTERQVAAHSSWKGHVYDQAAGPQVKRSRLRSRGKKRKDVYAADQWRVDERGYWISPGRGFRYPENTQVVARVKDELKRLGIPLPTYAGSRAHLESQIGTQLALCLDENGQL